MCLTVLVNRVLFQFFLLCLWHLYNKLPRGQR
jgi:cbb3-type cytochrome oxidase subunit 3